MRLSELKPVGPMLVSLPAEQMPTDAIVQIQRETVDGVNQGELPLGDAFRVTNLLLTIALQKLAA